MDKLTNRKPAGISTQGSQLPKDSQIALALTAMAANRRGEWDEKALEITTERLSRENFEDVMATLAVLGDTPRRDQEPSIPDTGTILLAVRAHSHPLRHLREIVSKLARNFGKTADEELLQLFQDVAGHRTDADLDVAYRTILRDENFKRMPTTGQFLDACGVLRVRRDGTKPE